MDSKKISNRKSIVQYAIIILSIIGLLICSAVLFPQVRVMIMDFGEQVMQKKASTYDTWVNTLFTYAMGAICFILFIDYCTLTKSGKELVSKVKQEIIDCLSEINFRSLLIPVIILFGVYFWGILTIIRANFLYIDDTLRSVGGFRGWFIWSRYVSDLLSIVIHGDTNLTDISPLPQLLAILILSCSSVALVYVIGNKKITVVRLLASIPLGLSPYFLECLSYKFDAPYMALSILASIVPFLFIARKKAFFFISVVSLLIMCMTYQAASGIYPLVAVILWFQDWNSKRKPVKEIWSMLGIAFIAFAFSMMLFRSFLMKGVDPDSYASASMHPLSQMLSGAFTNLKNYTLIIYHDLGLIWKIGIAIVCIFFIIKSVKTSSHKKTLPLFISMLVIGASFVLSCGVYLLLTTPIFYPRASLGFGIFLAILCIYVVSDYKKAAIIAVLALNWCLFVFVFSYGNALADQDRYAKFRITMLLHDLSDLYPNRNSETLFIQLQNSIGFAPTIKNISKHYPVIERLVPERLREVLYFDNLYYIGHYNFNKLVMNIQGYSADDFTAMDLPVVKDSYYHTIKSDGSHILVILKH